MLAESIRSSLPKFFALSLLVRPLEGLALYISSAGLIGRCVV
jgi:hypothetical protein